MTDLNPGGLDPRGRGDALLALSSALGRNAVLDDVVDETVRAYLAASLPPDGENPYTKPIYGVQELLDAAYDVLHKGCCAPREEAVRGVLAIGFAAGRAAATPPSNYDEAVKRGTPWGRAAATPDPRCGNCGHVSFHAAAATPDPRNGCRAPHCFSEYGTPCGNCPVAELREAAGRLLVAFAAEEDEHGFPFSFELRDAHRALVAAADRDKPEGGLFGPDTGTYARRGNDPLFADREENTDA